VLFEESLGGVATDLLDAVRLLAGDLFEDLVDRREVPRHIDPLATAREVDEHLELRHEDDGALVPRAILTSFSTPVTPTCESPTETSGADA